MRYRKTVVVLSALVVAAGGIAAQPRSPEYQWDLPPGVSHRPGCPSAPR